ncbi:hypothetical protein BJY04DRAFT_230003 [Aspergillus karnatakaensis]|uniref:uncharacterized protein n=1 Tax=Aspergillus karnatakaensis TaxID=1810916 RepID=UPI003CCE0E49
MTATQTETLALPTLNANAQYGDWRDDFFKQGYYVFKSAVSPDKATNYYYKKALDWLGSFDNGFDINNKDTWTKENLPVSFKNMYLGYCAAHERFMWDARTEPGVVKPFEQLWGTTELIASFDTFDVTLPARKDDDFRPWPHVDQAPERHGLACVQGFLNLSPAGPKDGGLLLTVGSSALFEEYFRTFTPRGRTAFRSKGCREIKIKADPGDLVMWDSRTIHHVAPIETDVIRSVLYICMTPAALTKEEDLKYKAELFGRFEATTHWPHCNIWGHGKAKINGEVDPLERDEPLEKPVVTDQILRLAGVKSYKEE